MWSSPLWTHSLCLLLIGNIFLLSPQLLLGLVSITYAPFSLESKRSKRFGIIILFCNSVMNLAAGDHSSTLVFGSLVTTATGVKIEVSKFTVMFMPSIISGLFSLSTYSCSLVCSTSSLSTSMFLLLLSDSLFVEIAMNSFLVMLLEIL